MPTEIVTETCPAPNCNLTEKDIEQFLDDLRKYMALFEPAFQRKEQLKRGQAYLHGLLGNAARKNVEQMALGLEDKVRSMQYFIGQKSVGKKASDRSSSTVDKRNSGRTRWGDVG